MNEMLKLLQQTGLLLSMSEVQNPQTNQIIAPTNYQIRLRTDLLRINAKQHISMVDNIWKHTHQQLYEFMTKYQTMPFSPITTQALFSIEKVKMIRTQQKLYFGETYNKKKQGRGISIHREGKIYEGQFRMNEKSGFGVEVYQNGNVYVGEFGQNKKHGRGSFFWFSLSTAQGKQEVQQYHGDWWGGLPDGSGEHTKVNGDVYVGKFKNGLKHGEGKQLYANGDRYKGQFINGLPEGYGEYTWADGSMFKGDFKQGARNGYGMWRSKKQPTGQFYKGHYMIDKKHGYGIYDWGNGYVYKGFWMDDLRYGEGALSYNGELEYNGYWENGEKVDYKPQPIADPVIESDNNHNGKAPIHETTQTSIGFNSRITDRGFTSQAKNQKRKNRSVQKQKSANKNQFSLTFVRERSHQKGKCGHKNCVPEIQIGKMPRPPWKNAWKK